MTEAMRPQLKDYALPAIQEFIRQKVEECGGRGVVVGLSGGIDSATVSKLCADAIGPDKVLNLFMPAGISPRKDQEDAESFSRRFGMEFKAISIAPAVEGFKHMLPRAEQKEYLGNIMARCRMVVLFHHANLMGRCVMGTSNKSELLTGYFTKFGDGGADFCPIGDLYKTEVRQLAKGIGIPPEIIDKVPSAGLWAGQTDEGELGITYDDLDQVLYGIERMQDREQIARETGLDISLIDRVWEMHRRTVHKRKMPLMPKVGLRTLGLDWRE